MGMSASGIFKLIANDGAQDRALSGMVLPNIRVVDHTAREREWTETHARFISMLYDRQSLLPAYHYWVLRRGLGDFAMLPLDVRRIIIRYTHRWYDRAVPLEEILARCERAGDKKTAMHVCGFMGGHRGYRDAIYRGEDEWWTR